MYQPSKFANKSDKFSVSDLAVLREDLMQSGLDSWQAGDLISAFLSGHGYGVSPMSARGAAYRIGASGCSLQHMQEEFEKLALVM